MFKKSLITLAIAATAVTSIANAASITVASKNVSIAGNTTAANASKIQAADLNAVAIDVGSDYIVNDLVVFTVSGATFDKTVTAIKATPTAGTATFTFVDYSDDNTVRFRVSTANHLAANDITLEDYVLKSGTPTDGTKIKISSNAISVNPLIGNYDAAAAAEVAEFVTQVKYTVGKLDGQVSTGAGRAEFTNTSSTLKDVLTITAANDTTAVDAITYNKSVHTVKGNFSYMMDYDLAANGGNANGKLDAAEITNAVTIGNFTSGVVTVNTGLDTVTITDTGVITSPATVQFNVVGNAKAGSILTAPQSFTIDTAITDGTTSTAIAQASAGSWSLDGSGADIAFLPFGDEYAQSITVTNSGTVVGAITVDLTAEGTTYTKTLVATSAAKSVTNISKEVAEFAKASGITGDARVNVTVNAPGIVVKGIYFHKATQDRVLTQ